MRVRSTPKVAVIAALVLTLAAGVVGVQAQRRRTSRRVTHPVRPATVPTPSPLATPEGGEPRLISSADDQQQQDDASRANANGNSSARRSASSQPDADSSNRTVRQLSNQVTQLNKRLDEMEKQRQTDLLQERLTRAEQRVEALQSQLSDVMEKQANLQARVDQIDEASRPENLDRQVATVGTFRPDEARDALRRQYDNEKKRVQAQLDVQNTRRTQLEKSLNDATQLADRIRTELDAALQREAEQGGTPSTTSAPLPRPSPSATPEPSPPPPQM
jgi:hypothetical protein